MAINGSCEGLIFAMSVLSRISRLFIGAYSQ